MEGIAPALRAAGVPLRLEILKIIGRSGPLSPSELVASGETSATLREAAYHVRALRDANLIVLDELRTTGGAAQHLYVLTPLGTALVDALPGLERADG